MILATPLLSLDLDRKTLGLIALGALVVVVVSARYAQSKVVDIAQAVNPVDEKNIINQGVTGFFRDLLDKPDDWELGYWFTTPAENAEVWDIEQSAWIPR